MKKPLLIAALAVACISMSAQQKGDMSVGGTLGFSGGKTSSAVNIGGNTTSTSSPTSTVLEINPEFSYFLIDNLSLSVGFDYSMLKEVAEATESRNLFSFTNLATVTLGANYYIPLIDGKLYYTPGVRFGFGGGSYVVQTGANQKTSTKIPFAFEFDAALGSMEFKPFERIGISLNLLDISVAYFTFSYGNENVKVSNTTFTAGLNYGISAGVKYYF